MEPETYQAIHEELPVELSADAKKAIESAVVMVMEQAASNLIQLISIATLKMSNAMADAGTTQSQGFRATNEEWLRKQLQAMGPQ
jgi:hypothetical protein